MDSLLNLVQFSSASAPVHRRMLFDFANQQAASVLLRICSGKSVNAKLQTDIKASRSLSLLGLTIMT
jgi:hypothetical protein